MDKTSQNLSGKRNRYIDFIKAAAIICVVLGHSFQDGAGHQYYIQGQYYDNAIHKLIYSFHMPMFMLVSGYLFAFSLKKRSWIEAIIQKIRTVLVPIAAWAVIPLTIALFGRWSKGKKITAAFICKKYIALFLENLWFLWAFLLCSLVVILVYRFLNNSKMVFLAGFVLTFFIPDAICPATYRFMYPFFLLGYFCSLEGWLKKYKKICTSKVFFIICGVLFAVLLTQYNYDSYIYTSKFYLFKGNPWKQLYIDFYRFLIGLDGSVFVMLVLAKIYPLIPSGLGNLIFCLGENSLGIYAVSGYLDIHLLRKITYSFPTINYVWIILETGVILVVSLIVTMMLKKIRILNKLFLGGR